MSTTRLICVQGPSQLLDVMSIFLSQQEQETENYHDVLVIGGLCMSGDQNSLKTTIEITKDLASFWNFSSIYDISSLEFRLSYIFKFIKRLGKLSSLIYLRMIATLIKTILRQENVDQVYVCRNWQSFNEILLFTYSNAEKICYGDLGYLDIDDEEQRRGLINPIGFMPIDRSYLVYPPDEILEKFSSHKIEIIEFDYKKNLIYDISESNVFRDFSRFCKSRLDGNILITLSNGTEADIYESALDEVQFYLSTVLLNSEMYDIVWVKPHPRQTLNQAQMLCDQLNQSGRQAFCIDNFGRYPLELFIPFIPSAKIICLHSYSGIISALLGHKKLVAGLDNKLINLFVKKKHRQSLTDYQKMYVKMLKKAQNNLIDSSNFNNLPFSPLSNSQNVILLNEYPCSTLIQQWYNNFNIDISLDFVDQISIKMYQCIDTDLKFFIPSEITGSEILYSQLSNFQWYYLKNKWEYQVAIKTCERFQKIIDVGCGRGEFLKLGKQREMDIMGIDMSSNLIQMSNDQDVNIENISTEIAAIKYQNFFDVVCCFQVLEHVDEPRKFILELLSMLKSNGRLILSVPNADSYLKYTDSPLDMPPHHMTKWSEETFQKLEYYFPVKIEKIIKEPLMTYHVPAYVATYTEVYKKRYPFIGAWLGKPFKAILYLFLYLGFRYFKTGNSLYIQYIKL